MDKTQKVKTNINLQVGDIVKLNKDTLFWQFNTGKESDVIRKAGTTYPVVDVFGADGVQEGVILEDYDPVAKKMWLASLGIDDVECVWKMAR